MKFEKFIEATRRTWNKQDRDTDFQHAFLGIIDETGELAGAIKKKVGYGKSIDVTNVKEELGDLSYFVARIIDQMNLQGTLYLDVIQVIDAEARVDYDKKIKDIKLHDLVIDIQLCSSNIIAYLVRGIEEENQLKVVLDSIVNIIRYCTIIAQKCKTKYPKILDANIAKLKKRFPEKFDSNLAEEKNRNRKAEAKEIEKNK